MLRRTVYCLVAASGYNNKICYLNRLTRRGRKFLSIKIILTVAIVVSETRVKISDEGFFRTGHTYDDR